MQDTKSPKEEQERRPRILVLDDAEHIVRLQKEILEEGGYEVETATTLSEAHQRVEQAFFDLLILDERLPTGSGTDFFQECRERYPDIGAIFITGYPDIDVAKKAFKLGALNFLEKEISRSQLLIAVEEALQRSELIRENRYLHHCINKDVDQTQIIGQSAVMREAMAFAKKAAAANAPVLLGGESGTGKEVLARAIHMMSARKRKPFLPENVGGHIPILESLLFGHAKGAFTGADRARQGAFEAAHGGTIFLDEIGDMPLDAQVRLLRVLDNKQVVRLGETTGIPIDARVIAATNKVLEKEVKEGRFREDLFYRLNVLRINLPPLRERGDDILLLSHQFLSQKAKEMHRHIKGFSAEALRMLCQHDWPGNVRELMNAIERAVILCEGEEVQIEHLQVYVKREKEAESPNYLDMPWDQSQAAFGKSYFQNLLQKANGDKSSAALIARVNRSTIYDCLARFGLDDPTLARIQRFPQGKHEKMLWSRGAERQPPRPPSHPVRGDSSPISTSAPVSQPSNTVHAPVSFNSGLWSAGSEFRA